MKRRGLLQEEASTEIHLNLTPLIDIMLVLLIFFIATTVFLEEAGVEVSKPRAATAVELDNKAILLALTADGRVFQGGREIGMDGVGAVIGSLLEEDPSAPVVIRADAQTTTELTVSLIDAAKLAGATVVSLATERATP
ncbi:MAG: biopolymer transporter ExbD [Verrucomicrobia bacterium]|jgi:biopolymer transport protein ExbD|nr:biopolymer transporter ExbD [Verrucomicrobiota bacterium]